MHLSPCSGRARRNARCRGTGIDMRQFGEGYHSRRSADRGHPSVEMGAIVGKAYDTLFKELCSAQALLTPEAGRCWRHCLCVGAGGRVARDRARGQLSGRDDQLLDGGSLGRSISRLRRLRPRVPDCDSAQMMMPAAWFRHLGSAPISDGDNPLWHDCQKKDSLFSDT